MVQTYGGIASGDVDSASITALNTANSNPVGIYIDSTTKTLDVLDALANTVGAFFGFDRDGAFEVGRIELASGTADAEFDSTSIITLQRLASSVPNHRVRVTYSKNYTVLNETDLGASVTAANRDFMVREALVEKAETAAVLTAYPNSQELFVDSLFATSAGASAEATRLNTLYGTQRDFYRVKVKTQPYTLKLNDVVKITFNRYNLTSGKLFRVISLIEDAAVNEVELELWG